MMLFSWLDLEGTCRLLYAGSDFGLRCGGVDGRCYFDRCQMVMGGGPVAEILCHSCSGNSVTDCFPSNFQKY